MPQHTFHSRFEINNSLNFVDLTITLDSRHFNFEIFIKPIHRQRKYSTIKRIHTGLSQISNLQSHGQKID